MIFTTSFLTVLAATATLARLSKSDSLNCLETYKNKYSICTKSIPDKKMVFYNENICIEFESELCQKYYKSSMKDIYNEFPECKGIMIDDESIKKKRY